MILHSKLTIAVAVRKALSTILSSFAADLGRKIILKTYNKLNSHHEVDIPEVISHLLEFPDHYIDKKFQYIHIILLLQYFKDHSQKYSSFSNNNILNIDS